MHMRMWLRHRWLICGSEWKPFQAALSRIVNCSQEETFGNLLSRLQEDKFSESDFFLFEHSRTQSEKKSVTGVQVVTVSQVQNIECRWQAILSCPWETFQQITHFQVHDEQAARAQTLTKRNPLTTHSVEAWLD